MALLSFPSVLDLCPHIALAISGAHWEAQDASACGIWYTIIRWVMGPQGFLFFSSEFILNFHFWITKQLFKENAQKSHSGTSV